MILKIYSEICDNFIFSKNSNTVNNHISSEAQKIATKSKKLSAKKKNKAQKEESSLMPTKYEIIANLRINILKIFCCCCIF